MRKTVHRNFIIVDDDVVDITNIHIIERSIFIEFALQNLIASVTFPITLSMYLLVRIEDSI